MNKTIAMKPLILGMALMGLWISPSLANPTIDRVIDQWAQCFNRAGNKTWNASVANPRKAQQQYRVFKGSCKREYAKAYQTIAAEGGPNAVAAFENSYVATVGPRYVQFLDAFGLTHQ
jgi:hypothetical protein